MMSIIRWKGILSFVAIVGCLLLIVQLFADSWIKWGIQRTLSNVLQVEVNVGQVKHQWSPLGLTIKQVQITDANAPQYNLYQIQQLTADIQFTPLLMNKVIIDKMVVDGVRFNQLRQSPGAVYSQTTEVIVDENTESSDIALPSVDDLLASSPLKTTAAANDLQAAFKQHDAALREQYQQLPTKEELLELQQQLKALKETDYKDPAALLRAKQSFDDIKQQLREKQQSLKQFKQALELAKADIGDKSNALKLASQSDYSMLKGAVAGDAGALSDITQAVFGEQAQKWSQWILTAVEKIAPLLASSKAEQELQERLNGRWIEFDDASKLPNFVIYQADVGIQWQQLGFSSHWQDITTEHAVIGRPTRFNVDADASDLWQQLKLSGEFSLDGNNLLTAAQSWSLSKLSLSDLALIDKNSLQGQLDSGLLSSQGTIKVDNNQITGTSTVNIDPLAIKASGTSDMTSAIAKSLTALSSLQLNATLSGDVQHPNVALTSNLDKQMANIITANLSPKAQQRLSQLQQALTDKANVGDAPNDQQWSSWSDNADGQLANIEQMLKQKLDNLVDKEKDKLKTKLLNKLFKDD
ncbi:TIGR03545 family protein [Alteromonadaceae bacterium BrNp21-10]|nr:TIGR03545 family protein [Alteromonadaceae bacterium BrNp21-10]